MSEQEETVRFEKTVSLEELKRQARDNPFEIFEKCPLEEIRKACLKQIDDYWYCDQNFNRKEADADWAEKCIKDLLQQKDPLWKDVLVLYIRNTKYQGVSWDESSANYIPITRSIEFALSLVNLEEGFLRSEFSTIAKFVVGKVKDCPEVYKHVPSMPKFIEKLLFNCILKNPDGTIHYTKKYNEADWHNIVRALSIIIKCQDFSFISLLEKLIDLIKNNQLVPYEYDFSPHIATAKSHLVILKETIDALKRQRHDIFHEEDYEKVAEKIEEKD